MKVNANQHQLEQLIMETTSRLQNLILQLTLVLQYFQRKIKIMLGKAKILLLK